MESSSIFALPASLEGNEGASNAHYQRVTFNRSFDGVNLSNGLLTAEWDQPPHRWWHPGRSGFRAKVRFGKINQSGSKIPFTMNDQTTLSQNVGDHIFQTASYMVNGTPVCKAYNNIPQIGALKRRMRDPSTTQSETGRFTNFEAYSFGKRMQDTCQDGHQLVDNHEVAYDFKAFTTQLNCKTFMDVAHLPSLFVTPFLRNKAQISITADPLQPNAARTIVMDSVRSFLNRYLEAGDTISLNGTRHKVSTPLHYEPGTEFGTISILCESVGIDFPFEDGPAIAYEEGLQDLINAKLHKTSALSSSRGAYKEVELWFQIPALPIFDIEHAIPGGRHTFELNPQTQQQLMNSVFESRGVQRTPANTFFEFTEFYFMAYTVDGKNPTNTDILLDFTTCRMQKISNIVGTGMVAKVVDVRPTTEAIAIMFQDNRASNDSRFPEAVFASYPAGNQFTEMGQRVNTALALERYHIEYAGTQYPVPDADMKRGDGVDTWTMLWINTIMSNGAYYNQHPEDLLTWLERGPFFYHLTLRPGLDRSTRVSVMTQWKQDFKVGSLPFVADLDISAADFTTMNLCVFDFSKQGVKLQMQNGKYTEIIIEEQ